jgi:hypothetical protein
VSLIYQLRWVHCIPLLLSLTITRDVWAWGGSVGADFSSPFVQGDPSMSISGSLSHNFSKKWGVALAQGVERNFYLDSATREWELADTVIAVNLYPRSLIANVNWTLRLQATLPTSDISQINEVYSKPEARLNASMPLMEGLSLGLNGFVRATLSRYESATVQDGAGGAPLPSLSYGMAQSGNWQWLADWSLAYGASYTEIIYHDIEYVGTGDPALFKQPDQAYSLSISLNWNINDINSINAAYSYGGLLLQPGIDDYVLFDAEDSRWSLGYAYTF